MPKLSKTVLANTFNLDCDRFLRFRLATPEERARLGAEKRDRPAPRLLIVQGRRWEAAKYQDMLDLAGPDRVAHALEPEVDAELGRRPFAAVPDLFDRLRRTDPPAAILEGEFAVPADFMPGLRELYESRRLDPVKGRPDILWIREAPSGAPLLGGPNGSAPEREIHIIDVKLAAEPSLKHFTEVTFYALALARALEREGLSDRYGVCAHGYIWPGTFDRDDFRNRHAAAASDGHPDPLAAALEQTLRPVPHEIYLHHVRRFFTERLPRVLAQEPLDASWHVIPKCQMCDYIEFCTQQAEDDDHLCRVAWLGKGPTELLRSQNIRTTQQMGYAIQKKDSRWTAAARLSQQLRAEANALYARTCALFDGEARPVAGRSCATMPRYGDMSIFLTVHFDPGSGITFAMGASRVYWPKGGTPDGRPIKETRTFVVDRADDMDTATERERLCEMVRTVHDWCMESDAYNQTVTKDFHREQVHLFVWDGLEMRQLRRMLERHMHAPEAQDAMDLIVRLFPPESTLPDPDAFKSQPYTVVKDVFRQIVALPLPHDYALRETVNAFHPEPKKGGGVWETRWRWGFHTPMNSQIPFERGYEVWTGAVHLHHPKKDGADGPLYTREEVIAGLEEAVGDRLDALERVVRRLRDKDLPYAEKLVLKKSGFRAAASKPPKLPESARRVLAFEKLNAIAGEIENRQERALPVEEREARFLSIRGIRLADGPNAEERVRQARAAHPEYAGTQLFAFTFSMESRDAKVKEGDFLLALSNEDAGMDLDMPWYRHKGLLFEEAKAQNTNLGPGSLLHARLRDLLGMEVVLLDTVHDPPCLVLRPSNPDGLHFARREGLLDMDEPMVLDPLFRDFHTKQMQEAMKEVGA